MGGYGASFAKWVRSSNPQPYDSYGNGAAMRVSPVGWAFKENSDIIRQAMMSAKVSHSHVEGLIGATAVADCVHALKAYTHKDVIRVIANNIMALIGIRILFQEGNGQKLAKNAFHSPLK